MLSTIHSGSLLGIDAHPVLVEVNSHEKGEPFIILVGLPDAAVKESQNRISSAMGNSGYKMPEQRTTVNLAPGDIKKEGTLYDLPIALALLAATSQIKEPNPIDDYIIAGELSLSGAIRPIKGGLALAILAKKSGKKGVILPKKSAFEASLVEGVSVIPADSLSQAAAFIKGQIAIQPLKNQHTLHQNRDSKVVPVSCFSEIKGQKAVRRAVEIAVAGGHNLLLIGPPGSGKSMISKRIPSIMPEPSLDEYLEILAIESAAGKTIAGEKLEICRPFRSPHHTISDVGLLGGGSIPGPGEISMAHNGVLFLDELPEYKRSALEVMRQPLEDGEVTITRSAGTITLPANFMLVVAMNPCPCGYMGGSEQPCRCSAPQIARYRSRISGPLLDRIDLHIDAPALSLKELQSKEYGESSEAIKDRVESCRKLQSDRFHRKPSSQKRNADLSPKEIRTYCEISAPDAVILEKAMKELNLSARAYDRILRVARTIADLAMSEKIETPHLLEAIQYRSLDRNLY
jgi:magnesium chelatase family protein